jgi:hypothetical protein
MATKYTNCKIDQIAKNIPSSSIARPSKIYPNLDFWFENVVHGSKMVYFQTKTPYLGKFLELKRLVFSMAIWNISRPIGILFGHLGILWQFGIFSPILVESGNPAKVHEPASGIRYIVAKGLICHPG